MAFKLFVVLAFFGIVSAHVAPLTLTTAEHFEPLSVVHVEPSKYTFTYGVHDSVSGDSKSATETRHGDAVKGEYTVNDADGFKRKVTYTADAVSGFKAKVERKPIADVDADIQASISAHSSVTPIAAPVVVTKDLKPWETTTFVEPAAPVVHFAPQIVKSTPYAFSSPLFIKSTPIIYSSSVIGSHVPKLTSSGPYHYGPGLTVA